jgi:hypothetical protein
MWTGDMLGVLDTVLDRAERKEALGHATRNGKISDASQITLGIALEEVPEDALISPLW